MQKGALISETLNSINGGLTTADSAVTESEVEAYLPEAIGYQLLVQYRNQVRFDGSRDLPEDFMLTQMLPVKKDEFLTPYAVFPIRPLSMDKNRGVRFVGPPDNSDNYIVQVEGASIAFKYYKRTMDNCLVTCRIEPIKEGIAVFIANLPDNVILLKTKIIPNPLDLADEDELPMPAGFAIDVMDQIVKYFTTQRQDPADMISDNKDINSGNKV